MLYYESILQKPADLTANHGFAEWFTAIADRLLNGTHLMVAGRPHRFVEVEFYRHGEHHADPFTHRDPIQRECGEWYFHRTAGVHRSGSFKGLDLSFGDGQAFAGMLIRSIETPDGTVIDGPSLCVDHLLAQTKHARVADLHRAVGGQPVWDESISLHLQPAEDCRLDKLYRTPRVGLTLKKAKSFPDMPLYVMRPYRYLTEPRRVKKGKPHMVLALHAEGTDAASIARLTGCPKGSVARYVEDFEVGRQEADPTPYYGKDLAPRDLCRLYGACHARATAQSGAAV
jgi:hypothetical protein